MSDETATPCAFCDPNNKGWGTKAIYEDTRLDLKKWVSRIAGHEVSDSHGLDYIILIQAHHKKVEAERATLAAQNRAMREAAAKDAADIKILRDCLLGWNNQFAAYEDSDDEVPRMWEPSNLSDAMDVLHRRADEERTAATPAGEVRP